MARACSSVRRLAVTGRTVRSSFGPPYMRKKNCYPTSCVCRSCVSKNIVIIRQYHPYLFRIVTAPFTAGTPSSPSGDEGRTRRSGHATRCGDRPAGTENKAPCHGVSITRGKYGSCAPDCISIQNRTEGSRGKSGYVFPSALISAGPFVTAGAAGRFADSGWPATVRSPTSAAGTVPSRVRAVPVPHPRLRYARQRH